jgi:hypothetical protein
MKCIQQKVDKTIMRVRDNRAFDLVKTKDWSFIPKSEWKKEKRPQSAQERQAIEASQIKKAKKKKSRVIKVKEEDNAKDQNK